MQCCMQKRIVWFLIVTIFPYTCTCHSGIQLSAQPVWYQCTISTLSLHLPCSEGTLCRPPWLCRTHPCPAATDCLRHRVSQQLVDHAVFFYVVLHINIITPCVCASGKAIGFICRLLSIVSTNSVRSRHLSQL